LIHYRLVPGFQGGHGLTFLGLSRHEWGVYHLWAAYLLLALILAHLILNFAFIRNVIVAKKIWLVYVLGLLGLMITAVFVLLPIKRTEGNAQGQVQRLRTGQGNHESVRP
jgi:membrane protease YdiL (CAAX protease family)